MKTLINYAEIAKDFVQSSIDSTVTTVEKIHITIADTAASTISSLAGPNETIQALHQKHNQTAQGIYQAIRSVNRNLGELATDAFEAIDNSEIAAKIKNQNQ
jgi:uncharacterized protein YaaR (DUF327 family)